MVVRYQTAGPKSQNRWHYQDSPIAADAAARRTLGTNRYARHQQPIAGTDVRNGGADHGHGSDRTRGD
jgi:hypothetical protein